MNFFPSRFPRGITVAFPINTGPHSSQSGNNLPRNPRNKRKCSEETREPLLPFGVNCNNCDTNSDDNNGESHDHVHRLLHVSRKYPYAEPHHQPHHQLHHQLHHQAHHNARPMALLPFHHHSITQPVVLDKAILRS